MLSVRNETIIVRARAGCQLGTRCPAPLTVTNFSPLYPTTYPPICNNQKLIMHSCSQKKVLLGLEEKSTILPTDYKF